MLPTLWSHTGNYWHLVFQDLEIAEKTYSIKKCFLFKESIANHEHFIYNKPPYMISTFFWRFSFQNLTLILQISPSKRFLKDTLPVHSLRFFLLSRGCNEFICLYWRGRIWKIIKWGWKYVVGVGFYTGSGSWYFFRIISSRLSFGVLSLILSCNFHSTKHFWVM